MILTKSKIDSIDTDFLIEQKIKESRLPELLLVVPTNRKIRSVKRKIISSVPNRATSKLNLETIGTISTNILFPEVDSRSGVLSEAASSILLKQSFQDTELEYFSAYKNEIPFGTLDRIKNVISEYKKHGITPLNIIKEAEALSGSEKIKALDISNIYKNYLEKFKLLNVKEIGDVYADVNSFTPDEFIARFRKLYSSVNLVIINGFAEFTQPEIEIINKISCIKTLDLFLSFDYYKYNPSVFAHLDKCYEKLKEKGFVEIKDTSVIVSDKFQTAVKENLFAKDRNQITDYADRITVIPALTREKEVEIIAKEIKNLIIEKKIPPSNICVVFNLIQNYSPVIRDVFQLYGLPFNLTDRYSLKTSSPVVSIINFLEILENDFYYKNIFRALSSGILSFVEIDQSVLMKAAFNLKIISGYENWKNSLHDALARYNSSDEEEMNSMLDIETYEKALSNIQLLYKYLAPFNKMRTLKDFYKNLTELIFSLGMPEKLINNSSYAIEENVKAVSTFLEEVEEVLELLEMEYKSGQKFTLTFFLNNLRTIVSSSRYNIKEKPNYGIQITTPNEIRGLRFNYLFISGLCDGDLPTRYNPEIFYSGSYARGEKVHQLEERYAFYQSLCSWKERLYFTYPLQEDRKEFVMSNFLNEFIKIFKVTEKSENSYGNFIFSKEDFLYEAGKLGVENVNKFYTIGSNIVDLERLKKSVDINEIRIAVPFEESEFTGYINKNLSAESKKNLEEYSDKEFSISQLETYAKCPYKYFSERVLKLKPLKEPTEDIEALEMGSLLHTILFKFYTGLKQQKIILAQASDTDFNIAVDLMFTVAEEAIGKVNFNSPVTFYEKEKIMGIDRERKNSILYKFLIAERENEDGFIPEYFEIGFGNSVNNDKDKLLLKAGKVNVTGKIDRIDIKSATDKFKVVDYKSGGKKISIDDMHRGIELQLPLYMYAAKELIKMREANAANYQPTGAEIYSLKYRKQDFGKKLVTHWTKKKMSDEEKENFAAEANKELINECIFAIERYVSNIALGKFNLSTLDNREKVVCSKCNFKAVCRIQDLN